MNKKGIIIFIIIIILIATIVFSVKNISLNPSIRNLFPRDEKTERSISLAERSPISDKVILYIEVKETRKLRDAVKRIDKIIYESGMSLGSAIPGAEDINDLMEYVQTNSLLLYPYDSGHDPFSEDEIKTRLRGKEDYLASLAFLSPQEGFFLDPLNFSFEILKKLNASYKGRFDSMFGGIVSKNEKAYIRILKSGFYNEDYGRIKRLKELDNRIIKISEESGFRAFLFSSHLFFNESRVTSKRDVRIIFFVTIALLVIIFFFFFRKISLLLYSYVPILGGLAFALLFIAVFFRQFGAIAMGFGATTAGISIDYSIYYLIYAGRHESLKEVRRRIGFSLFLGFITTISAFTFLPFSGIQALREISIFGIMSLTVSFLFSWFILQNLVKPDNLENKIRTLNFRIPGRRPFFIWIGLCIFFIILFPFFRFEDNIFNLDMKHKDLNERLKLIKKNFNESTESIFLVFEGRDRDETIDKSHDAYRVLENAHPELSFFSPGMLLPSVKMILARKKFVKEHFNKKVFLSDLRKSDFSYDSFDDWLNKIEELGGKNNVSITKLPLFFGNLIESMFVQWNNKEYLLIPVFDRRVSKEISSVLSKNGIDFFIVDIMKDSAGVLIKFEKHAFILLGLSVIVIFIILLIAYRKIIHAFCAILPGLSGLLVCIGISVVTGRNYNMMHFVSSILITGIGVDYGIFITGAFRNKFDDESIGLTFNSVFIAALTTLAGFGVLSFSGNYSLFSLGTSLSGGIIMAFLTVYLALPFILKKEMNHKEIR